MYEIDKHRRSRQKHAENRRKGPARTFRWGPYFLKLLSVPLASLPILALVILFGRSAGIPSSYCALIFLGTLAVNAAWLKWGGILMLHGNPVAECPKCGKRVRYLSADRGQDVKCPACEYIWLPGR